MGETTAEIWLELFVWYSAEGAIGHDQQIEEEIGGELPADHDKGVEEEMPKVFSFFFQGIGSHFDNDIYTRQWGRKKGSNYFLSKD